MKTKLCLVFLLTAGVAAYAQGRPTGVPGGPPMNPGAQSAPGQMPGQMPGQAPGQHPLPGEPGSVNPGPIDHPSQHPMSEDPRNNRTEPMGKQSPDVALAKDTQLSQRLGTMLPNGMSAQQACSGFKNLGECVAAIHVSQNLGIPFNDLKTKLTGGSSESLGKAIQALKPDVNAKSEEHKAKQQADDDLKGQ